MGVLSMGLIPILAGCSSSADARGVGTGGGAAGGSMPAASGGAGNAGSGGGSTPLGSGGGGSSAIGSGGTGNGGSGGAPAGGSSGSAGNTSGGTGGTVRPCDKSMATWTDDADPFASHDFGGSFLRKNFWNRNAAGAGSLTLWAADSRCWGVNAASTDTTAPGTVKSYPDMARGWVVGTAGFKNSNSALPIQVKDLRKAKIRWNMSISGSPLRHYALWDIYFHETATPGAGTAPVNLMIKQRVVDPDNYEQDKESAGATAVTNTFSGITFRENKNTGLKSGSRIVVELFALPVNGADMGVDDMTLDLKEVIDHYVADGSIKTTDYLTSIQTGWEILAGGSFVTHDFWTALQDEAEPTN
jgi:hypothetical protein